MMVTWLPFQMVTKYRVAVGASRNVRETDSNEIRTTTQAFFACGVAETAKTNGIQQVLHGTLFVLDAFLMIS